MKYKNKKQKKTMLLLLILLGVTVGFALLSTTLKINGTANIKSNTWNIHWENVVPNNESTISAETPTIGENGTKVSYEVELELPGDFYEFTVDAKNDGSINGKIDEVRHTVKEVTTVNNEEVETTATLPSYILYTVYYDGTTRAPAKGDLLEAHEKQTYRVRIEYDRNSEVLPETNKVYRITDEIDYVQTTDTKNVPTVTPSSTDPILGGLQFGDEICIKGECFNVLTTNENKTVMLAKYNLLVGNTCTSASSCTAIPTNTEGYGKQSSTALGTGDYGNEFPAVGTINFSNTTYWFEQVGSDKHYNGTVSTNSPGVWENYSSYPNSNASQYLSSYLNILKDNGAPSSTTIGMLDVTLANSLFNFIGNGTCWDDTTNYELTDRGKFIVNTSFWLGSAASGYDAGETVAEQAYGSVWRINRKYLDQAAPGDVSVSSITDNLYGIRPVVEIPTSAIVFDGWRFVNPGAAAVNQKWEYWANGKKVMEGLKYLDGSYDNLVVGEHYYYFHEGFMYMGWVQDASGNRYFFNNEAGAKGYARGYRFENTTKTIDGVSYTFDADGKCTANCEQAQNVLVEQ